MKRLVLLLTVVIETLGAVAQNDNYADYSLEGLSKACSNYDEISSFHDGLSVVVKINPDRDAEAYKLYGVIDKEGNEVVPCTDMEIYNFKEGRAIVKKNKKFGFINKQGKIIIPCKYDEVFNFSEGLAVVVKNDLYGYIDSVGKEVFPCIYSTAYSFSEGLACVYKKNGPDGYINKRGKMVLHHTGGGGSFSGGLAPQEDTKFMDKNGKIVFEVDIDQPEPFSEGLAAVRKNWVHGYIDKAGHFVVPLTYCVADDFSEGLAAVGKGQCEELEREIRYGYIDKKGDVVIPFIYEWGSSFNGGLAAVKKSNKEKSEYIFIDKSGQQAFPLVFDEARGFSEGLAAVKKGGKWGYVDKNGKCSLDY